MQSHAPYASSVAVSLTLNDSPMTDATSWSGPAGQEARRVDGCWLAVMGHMPLSKGEIPRRFFFGPTKNRTKRLHKLLIPIG
jgi:hypothetical protein